MTALIGRDAELSALKQHLANAISGKGYTVLISGEPGIGKTRLVEEFRKHAEGVRILSGAAMSGSAHPFQIFSKALEGITDEPLFEEQEYTSFTEIFAVNGAGLLMAKASSEEGGLDADIFAGMLSAVQDFVRDSFGGRDKAGLRRLEYGKMKILIEHGQHLFLTAVFSGNEHPDMKNTLTRILKRIEESHGQLIEKWTGKRSDIKPVQDDITKLADVKFLVRKDLEGVKLENERVRIADRALETLAQLSGEKTLIMFMDDLHWADESSLFVLQYLARNIRRHSVLLVGTSRPGESDGLEKAIGNMRVEEIIEEMNLVKLDTEYTKSLIDMTFAPNDFPDSLVERLYEQSKGNPLFVTEMLKGMFQDGSIAEKDGKYCLVSDSYTIPATVEEVINRRLETLDSNSMAMVEYASCIGLRFDASLAASNRMIKDPIASLDKLLVSGILLEKNGTLEFSHAVFQTMIYNNIGERWKSSHHKNIGEYLENTYSDRLDTVIYDLARHFSETREFRKSSDYCIRAGEKAEGAFAVEQALGFYLQALSALSKWDVAQVQERMVDVLERIGDVQTVMGNYDEANDNFLKARDASNDGETKARMLRKISNVLINKGDFDRSLELTLKAKSELEDSCPQELGRILMGEGIAYYHRGFFDEAMKLYRDALDTFEKAGDVDEDIANVLRMIGSIYQSKGEYDDALEHQEKCLEMAEKAGHNYLVAAALNNIGTIHYHRGVMNLALEFYERSLRLREKIGDKQGVSATLNNIGLVLWNKGEMDKALDVYGRNMEIAEKIGDMRSIGITLSNVGAVHYDKGEPDKALDFYRRSLEILEKIGSKQIASTLLMNIGLVHADRGESNMALRFYERSLEIRTNLDDKPGMAMSLGNLGSVYYEMGEFHNALEHYEKGLAICLDIGELRLSIHDHIGIAEIKLEMEETQKAIELAEKALETAIGMGAKSEEGMSHRVLGTAFLKLGDYDAASKNFEKSKAILEEVDDRIELAKLQYEYAFLFKVKNNQATSKRYLEKTLSEFERMGMKPRAEKCRKALEGLN